MTNEHTLQIDTWSVTEQKWTRVFEKVVNTKNCAYLGMNKFDGLVIKHLNSSDDITLCMMGCSCGLFAWCQAKNENVFK